MTKNEGAREIKPKDDKMMNFTQRQTVYKNLLVEPRLSYKQESMDWDTVPGISESWAGPQADDICPK